MFNSTRIWLCRTIGQLRHHCVTKHYWCHECEASGDREQMLTWMFHTEIDLRAHRLQQHASGLSRSQLAAERTISPAELNFNLIGSLIANRRELQSRAPNLVDYVPPPEPPGNTTRLWQRIVQRCASLVFSLPTLTTVQYYCKLVILYWVSI